MPHDMILVRYMALELLQPTLVLMLLSAIVVWCIPLGYVRCLTALCICANLLAVELYLLADTFTGKGVDESVLFHLYVGASGVGKSLVVTVAATLFIAIGVAVMLFWLLVCMPCKKVSGLSGLLLLSLQTTAPLTALGAIGTNPFFYDLWYLYEHGKAQSVDTHVNEYMYEFDGRNIGKLKNVVFIYAESLEGSYFEEKRFPGLMLELGKLAPSALRFEGLAQAPMTGWTIAGMTASQCGIPLAVSGKRDNSLDRMSRFIPGKACVGDVLSRKGYALTYMGGADLQFAGKGKFYAQHGFDQVMGKKELEQYAGKTLPGSSWGVYDDELFPLLKMRLQELVRDQDPSPFALFALTLDTHAPQGHETPSCIDRGIQYGDGSSSMLNAVVCADYLIADFIRWFVNSDLSENTLLVVASDHLVMRNDAGLDGGDKTRENLFWVFGSDQPPRVINRQGTTLDIAPTVLSLMGFDARGFGLGRNLLGGEPTLAEKFGKERFYSNLFGWRRQMWESWK